MSKRKRAAWTERRIVGARRRRVPAWRWSAVVAVTLLIAIVAAGGPAAQEGDVTGVAADVALPAAEVTRLMPEAEVAEKRPLRRQQVREQYEQYLVRRLGEAPPPKPVPDIAEALDALPAEFLGQAPAEEAR